MSEHITTNLSLAALALTGSILIGRYVESGISDPKPIQELSQVFHNGENVKIINNLVLDGSNLPSDQSIDIVGIDNKPVGKINSGEMIKSTWAIDITHGNKIENADGSVTYQDLVMFYGVVDEQKGYYFINKDAMSSVGGHEYSTAPVNGVVDGNNIVVDGKNLPAPTTTFLSSSNNIQ
jgi:hypothetical protein